MSWCTSSGHILLCLLSVSTCMLRGHATRSWLVCTFAHVVYVAFVDQIFAFYSIILNGMYLRILSRCIIKGKSQGSCSLKFEQEGNKMRVFLRTWDIGIFRRVCKATLHHCSSDTHQEIAALGK